MTHESVRVSRPSTDGRPRRSRWVPALAGLALVVISMVLVTPALAAVRTTPGKGWLVAVIMGGVAFGYALRYVTSRAQVAAVRRYATRDSLTGLPNRGLFDETLTREVARQRRKATPLGLVLIDLDGFKRLNDTRGHGRGDDALRAVAETIVGRVRESDLPARIGGDEFAVVLPDCSPDDAMRVGEELRQRIELAVGPLVTASVGVAVMPDHATDADGLVAAADAALYVAKGRGGNEACMGPVHAVALTVDEWDRRVSSPARGTGGSCAGTAVGR